MQPRPGPLRREFLRVPDDDGPIGYRCAVPMVRPVVLLVLVSAAYALPASAHACSLSFSPIELRPIEARGEVPDQLPANVIFYSDGGPPELGSALMATFEEDATWSTRASAGPDFPGLLTAFRIAEPDRFVGTPVELDRCGFDRASVCEVVLGPLDVQPPSRPTIDGLHVTLHRRQGHGLGGFSCGNVESMDFDAEVTDDGTTPGHLHLLGYFGTDEAELAAVTEPEVMFWPWPSDDGFPAVHISLGFGGTHDRDGEHFRKGRYCFSLSAVDLAGNESERSDAECIDTRDTSDPRVDFAGCSCTTTRGSWPGGLLLSLLLVRRRRGNAPKVTRSYR